MMIIWTDAFIFLQGGFAGPQSMTDTTLRIEMEKRVWKVSTYWGKLQNLGRLSEDGLMLELAS